MARKRLRAAFFKLVQHVGEIVPFPLVLRRKTGEISIVGRLRCLPDEYFVMIRVVAERILLDEEERRVSLHEGPPPPAAPVLVNPSPGIGIGIQLLLFCRGWFRNHDFRSIDAPVCDRVRRAAAHAARKKQDDEKNRCECFHGRRFILRCFPRISGIYPLCGASVHWCGASCRPDRRGAVRRGPLPCASPARL